MKRMILMALVAAALLAQVVAAQAWDRTGYQMRDMSREVVSAFAPDGALTAALTLYSTTVDLTGTLWWGVYAPSAVCKVRLMPAANSTKSSYAQFSTPAAAWTVRGVNKDTPFMNISGCTSGELTRQ